MGFLANARTRVNRFAFDEYSSNCIEQWKFFLRTRGKKQIYYSAVETPGQKIRFFTVTRQRHTYLLKTNSSEFVTFLKNFDAC
ncbi:hypothetical protein D584_14614 [Brucella intermedia M86]|uniref:Uncharacterized protein n=1 Tax=Brucella intermedia M86 TaxID=1234597 RepID=M5JXS8_9HYPH|nr:hypothetical protein D584_14614 [Brucella intermedia M86]